MKPLFSDKSISGDKINLTENCEHVKAEVKAEILICFFSDIGKNLKILQYSNYDPIVQSIVDPTLEAIAKYKNHSDILTIQPSRHGCISDASLRLLIQGLREISKRTDLQTSETSPRRLIKDVSSETSLRSLRLSQRHL